MGTDAGRSLRTVFALALLVVAPSGARAGAADSQVAVVARMLYAAVDDLGTAPLTVTVSRIIFTPRAGEDDQSLSGPRLVMVESGTLEYHAIGAMKVIRAVAETGSGPTAISTPESTPTPVPSPVTEVTLGPGDAAPVPIWTMHSFRNDGDEPAVILDVRITADGVPDFPADLDVETLAQATGLTTLPTGRATIALGQSTVAAGGTVLAAPEGVFHLVAAVHGGTEIEEEADGSVRNTEASPRDVYVVSIASVSAAGPREPAQPATGPGGAKVAFAHVVSTHYGPEEAGLTIWEPAEQEGTTAPGPFPVVLYLAGCCTGDPNHYTSTPDEVGEWIEHLTQRGAIVIAPRLRAAEAVADLMAAMREAMAELERPGHAQPDWKRLGVIGFSYGGLIGPLYAGAAAAEGLPVPRAIFSTVAYDPGTPPDLSAIPASTYVIVLTTEGDDGGGARRLWAALTTVPADHREFVKVVTDIHGTPALTAAHELPATAMWGTLNALDWYGTWKLGDALLSCTFAGQDCTYAFGNTSEERFMGYWSDGVPVAELEVVADPGPPDPATLTA